MNANNILLLAGISPTDRYVAVTLVAIIVIGFFLRYVVFQNASEEYKHNHND